MKAITALHDKKLNDKLARSFRHLSRRMLRQYEYHGETKHCIDKIKQEANKLCHTKLNKQHIMQSMRPFDVHVMEDNCHYVFRIIQDEQLDVALHLTPAGTKFPLHAHSDTLNLLVVLAGTLQIEQASLKNPSQVDKKILTKDACSIGLLKFFNHHSIKTTAPLTAFFSIRCNVQKEDNIFEIPRWISTPCQKYHPSKEASYQLRNYSEALDC